MNKVNKELEEVGYKGRKVDLLAHYAYCEWKIRTREELGQFPSFVLWSSGRNHIH
jgi:hypothetical protein